LEKNYAFLIVAIIRAVLALFILYKILIIKKLDVTRNQFNEKLGSYLIFGMAILFSTCAEKMGVKFIGEGADKISFLLLMDISSKSTFISGIIGQSIINKKYLQESTANVSNYLIIFSAVFATLVFAMISILVNSKENASYESSYIWYLICAYTLFQSLNQIIVPIAQREISVEKTSLFSLISTVSISVGVLISMQFNSLFILVFGLLFKAMAECYMYSKVPNVKKNDI